MKNVTSLMAGLLLLSVGVLLLLHNVTVVTFEFYKINGTIPMAPFLIAAFGILAAFTVGFGRLIFLVLSGVDVIAIIASVIAGMEISVTGTGTVMLLFAGFIAIGLCLILKGFIGAVNIQPSD